MSDTSTYLVIQTVPNPAALDKLPSYISQIVPVMIAGGGEPGDRFSVNERISADTGPGSITFVKFASADAIKKVLSSEAYAALAPLRSEVFTHVDLTICSPA